MSTIPFTSFVGPTYVSQSPIADGERCINWYVERIEAQGATVPSALYPTPGVTSLGSVTKVGGRGAYVVNGRLFVVFGDGLYEVNSGWTGTLLGTLSVNSNPATLTSNGTSGNQLFVTSGTVGSLYNLNTGVFTASVVTAVTMGGMVDGYFIGLDSVTGTLKISSSLDGTTWDPTDVALRSAAPDPFESLCINNRQIVLWGAQSGEIWGDSGGTFPFALANGSNFGVGIAAKFSAATINGVVYWLGQTADGSRRVYKLQGYTPIPISTHAVDYALAQYSSVSDAQAMAYELYGHLFYVLNFPMRGTWVYDATENLWHERGTWNSALNRFDVWGPQSHAYAFNKHIVVDRASGNFGDLTDQAGTEIDGSPIRRVRVSPTILKNLDLVNYACFELMLEPGLGVSGAGQGSDPIVMLRTSRNGGKTWSNERQRSAGKLGEYDETVRWLKCGAARKMVFEVSVSDPVPFRLLTAFLDIGGGA